MSEKEKMLAGETYNASDPELVADRERAQKLLVRFNATTEADGMGLLAELLDGLGETTVVQRPFLCDYGYNLTIGRKSFVNYNCVFLDCARIDIGNDVAIGPAVQLYTAEHPLDALERRSGMESASPIRIGDNVWIGGGSVVLSGVTIGEGAVIGAGSVVTRDVPAFTVVVGNPARVVKQLSRS
ncbi:MAG: maa [Marmoricola sp.]|nr:maa [Marmoricola sp.]